jgi:hypothetical protein
VIGLVASGIGFLLGLRVAGQHLTASQKGRPLPG